MNPGTCVGIALAVLSSDLLAQSGRADCAQRGRDSLRIVWMREGGASVERALQDARTSSERQLVQDVWRRRGSASQVQAEVEADCLADLERRERYGAPSQSMSVGGSSPGAERSPAGDPQAAERARQAQAARAAEQRQATCARLNARMDNLRTRERSGGNAATMDRLNEERRRLQNEIGNAGC